MQSTPLNIAQRTAAVAKIATTPSLTLGKNVGTNPPLFSAISNGDAVFFAQQITGEFICLRVKMTGEYCIYMSQNYPYATGYNPGINSKGSVRQLNENSFLLTSANGTTNYFVVPDYFAPNEFVTVKSFAFTPPPPHCGGVYNKTFFDAERQIIAYQYAQSFPDDSYVYADFYNADNSFINAGFIGLFPNGTNGFDRTSLQLPPFMQGNFSPTAGDLFYSRDLIVYNSIGHTGFPAIGSTKQKLIGENFLSCAEATNKCYAYSADSFNSFQYAPYGSLGGILQVSYNCGGTDIPGAACTTSGVNGSTFATLLFNSATALLVNHNSRLNSVAVSKTGQFVALDFPDTYTLAVGIYIGQVDISPLITAPAYKIKSSNALTNNARPVSINGKFIA